MLFRSSKENAVAANISEPKQELPHSETNATVSEITPIIYGKAKQNVSARKKVTNTVTDNEEKIVSAPNIKPMQEQIVDLNESLSQNISDEDNKEIKETILNNETESKRQVTKLTFDDMDMEEEENGSSKRNISFGLYSGSSDLGSLKNITGKDYLYSAPLGFNLCSIENNMGGVNALYFPSKADFKYSYSFPVSYGLSFRIGLFGDNNRGWNKSFIETGIIYSRLKTNIDGTKETQKLDYIGIPVNYGYSILRKGDFSLYAIAGGAVEKCISAKYNKWPLENISAKNLPLQFSLSAFVGAQYLFLDRFSIYIEPGARYFFVSNDTPQSIRKAKPFDFNLNIGLRVSFE